MLTLDLNKETAPGLMLDLSKAAPAMKNLKGGLNWNTHPLHADCVAKGYDLDIFIYCLNDNGKVTAKEDVVYFGNKADTSGMITVPVDNQTGADTADGEDDEFFTMALESLPAKYASYDVYVFIHEADERGQNFGMVADASFSLSDADTGVEEVRYNLTQEFSNETCIHVASIVNSNGQVSVKPMGVGAVATPNEVIAAYC